MLYTMKILKVFAIFSAAALMVACGTPKAEGSKEVRDLLPSKGETDTTSCWASTSVW